MPRKRVIGQKLLFDHLRSSIFGFHESVQGSDKESLPSRRPEKFRI